MHTVYPVPVNRGRYTQAIICEICVAKTRTKSLLLRKFIDSWLISAHTGPPCVARRLCHLLIGNPRRPCPRPHAVPENRGPDRTPLPTAMGPIISAGRIKERVGLASFTGTTWALGQPWTLAMTRLSGAGDWGSTSRSLEIFRARGADLHPVTQGSPSQANLIVAWPLSESQCGKKRRFRHGGMRANPPPREGAIAGCASAPYMSRRGGGVCVMGNCL